MQSDEGIRDDFFVPDDPHEIVEREGCEQLYVYPDPGALQRPETTDNIIARLFVTPFTTHKLRTFTPLRSGRLSYF
jgi:hypothetical protein